ncbi:hypothetical protein BB560_002660 [Smittium megazygosporum]|uniref:PH domain-containing protein n=1 Tax=Smittium megazygosporum TaxID=133381 RepID=A0A2T9ZE53_9FUNG|nr:hypothetical protein BB560_002660 [Smittium megazygosporum]
MRRAQSNFPPKSKDVEYSNAISKSKSELFPNRMESVDNDFLNNYEYHPPKNSSTHSNSQTLVLITGNGSASSAQTRKESNVNSSVAKYIRHSSEYTDNLSKRNLKKAPFDHSSDFYYNGCTSNIKCNIEAEGYTEENDSSQSSKDLRLISITRKKDDPEKTKAQQLHIVWSEQDKCKLGSDIRPNSRRNTISITRKIETGPCKNTKSFPSKYLGPTDLNEKITIPEYHQIKIAKSGKQLVVSPLVKGRDCIRERSLKTISPRIKKINTPCINNDQRISIKLKKPESPKKQNEKIIGEHTQKVPDEHSSSEKKRDTIISINHGDSALFTFYVRLTFKQLEHSLNRVQKISKETAKKTIKAIKASKKRVKLFKRKKRESIVKTKKINKINVDKGLNKYKLDESLDIYWGTNILENIRDSELHESDYGINLFSNDQNISTEHFSKELRSLKIYSEMGNGYPKISKPESADANQKSLRVSGKMYSHIPGKEKRFIKNISNTPYRLSTLASLAGTKSTSIGTPETKNRLIRMPEIVDTLDYIYGPNGVEKRESKKLDPKSQLRDSTQKKILKNSKKIKTIFDDPKRSAIGVNENALYQLPPGKRGLSSKPEDIKHKESKRNAFNNNNTSNVIDVVSINSENSYRKRLCVGSDPRFEENAGYYQRYKNIIGSKFFIDNKSIDISLPFLLSHESMALNSNRNIKDMIIKASSSSLVSKGINGSRYINRSTEADRIEDSVNLETLGSGKEGRSEIIKTNAINLEEKSENSFSQSPTETISSENQDICNTETLVIKEGWVQRKTSTPFGLYKKQYIKLCSNGMLCFFKSDKSKIPFETLNIKRYKVSKKGDWEASKSNSTLDLHTGKDLANDDSTPRVGKKGNEASFLGKLVHSSANKKQDNAKDGTSSPRNLSEITEDKRETKESNEFKVDSKKKNPKDKKLFKIELALSNWSKNSEAGRRRILVGGTRKLGMEDWIKSLQKASIVHGKRNLGQFAISTISLKQAAYLIKSNNYKRGSINDNVFNKCEFKKYSGLDPKTMEDVIKINSSRINFGLRNSARTYSRFEISKIFDSIMSISNMGKNGKV